MKKSILALILAMAILLTGCITDEDDNEQSEQEKASESNETPESIDSDENQGDSEEETLTLSSGEEAETQIEQIPIKADYCLAFDAIIAIAWSNEKQNRKNDIDEQVREHFKGREEMGSDSPFRDLLEVYSFEEVKNMDLKTLAEVFPDCLKANSYIPDAWITIWKKKYAEGFEILMEMGFESLWEEQCLPFLTEQSKMVENAFIRDSITQNVILDIQRLKPERELGVFTVFLTYFSTGTVSFQLSENSYLTNYWSNDISTQSALWLLTHELIHSFSSEELKEIYRQAIKADEFLSKTYKALSVPNHEEEFVVALEHFISVRNGVRTEREARESISEWYGSCMPVAVIVFDELMKLTDIPEDINAWIIDLFESEVIKAGEIESKAESISPGFVEKFTKRWGDIIN
ncbi:MAG: hypothetical protein FWG44_02275 [Oscillospiraceae bacterium]|nr:hypothetical protein [Oscillospiraceae bacterium]